MQLFLIAAGAGFAIMDLGTCLAAITLLNHPLVKSQISFRQCRLMQGTCPKKHEHSRQPYCSLLFLIWGSRTAEAKKISQIILCARCVSLDSAELISRLSRATMSPAGQPGLSLPGLPTKPGEPHLVAWGRRRPTPGVSSRSRGLPLVAQAMGAPLAATVFN